jgi:hypothetical protein
MGGGGEGLDSWLARGGRWVGCGMMPPAAHIHAPRDPVCGLAAEALHRPNDRGPSTTACCSAARQCVVMPDAADGASNIGHDVLLPAVHAPTEHSSALALQRGAVSMLSSTLPLPSAAQLLLLLPHTTYAHFWPVLMCRATCTTPNVPAPGTHSTAQHSTAQHNPACHRRIFGTAQHSTCQAMPGLYMRSGWSDTSSAGATTDTAPVTVDVVITVTRSGRI